jgi:hypothetical protein
MSDAHEAIRNLLGRYAEGMDAGDFEAVGALFANGRLMSDRGDLIAEGAEGVTAMYARGTQLYDGSPRTRHLNLNHIMDVDEEAGVATVRSVYVVFQGTGALPLQPIITGRYVDRFARTDDLGWHFTERAFSVDVVGDLSHHLTWSPPL